MSVATLERADPVEADFSTIEQRLSDLAFIVGLGLLIGIAFWYGRGLWFYSDEWNIITTHYSGNWLEGFNGQWILIPVAVFWALLQVFGMFNYLPFRVAGLSLYALAIVLFHRWARRRVRPAAAALAALAIAWYSTSINVVMMPLLMNFTIPVGMLFASWMLLDRCRKRSDVGAAVCLGIGMLSSNVGLVVLVMIGIEFVVSRARWRRWWIFAPALVVWVPWFFIWYEPIGPAAQPLHAFHWGVGLTESYARGFFSGWYVGQWLWLGVLTALLVWVTIRRHWTPRAIAVVAGLAFFVAGASFRIADYYIPIPPDPNWYLWLYSVLVMTLLVESLRDVRIPLTVLGGIAVVVAAGGYGLYTDIGAFRANGIAMKSTARTWFAAADALGPRAPADAVLPVNFVPVRVGDYANLRRAEGSLVPGITLAMLGDERTRQTADAWMAENLGVQVEQGGVPGQRCRGTSGASSDLGQRLPIGASVVVTTTKTPAQVRLRRFAFGFASAPFAVIAPNRTVHFSVTTDNSTIPWFVQVEGATQVMICGPGG